MVKYWTPIQRLHQVNEYFSRILEYKNFIFWHTFTCTFFSNQSSSTLKIREQNNVIFEIPLCLLGRLFYNWVGDGGAKFCWQLEDVRENIQSQSNSLALEGAINWTSDYDNGLSMIRQFGKVTILFKSSNAVIESMDWDITGYQIYYSQKFSGLEMGSDFTERLGFPKNVHEFLTSSTLALNCILIKELYIPNGNHLPFPSPISPLEEAQKR